jgi:hypothetical protein
MDDQTGSPAVSVLNRELAAMRGLLHKGQYGVDAGF